MILAVFSIVTLPATGQVDTLPSNHPEYAQQMRTPFFLFAENFRDVRASYGRFEVRTASGEYITIIRWVDGFQARLNGRIYAEYQPYIMLSGEFIWRASYADGRTRTIRRADARQYRDAGTGWFTRN